MELKTLIKVNWHTEIPDGDEEVRLFEEEFDFEFESVAKKIIESALIKFGVNPCELFYQGYDKPNQYRYNAVIGRFDEQKYLQTKSTSNREIPIYTSECDILISCSYVWQHRGKYYTLQELT